MVKRFDRLGGFGKAIVTDAGFLKAPAKLSRVGVFTYQKAAGGVQRELRLPEEVFNADSVASFELVPLTDDHPANGVDATNAKQYQAGSVADVKADGDFLAATLMITDADLVAKVSNGKQELSCGYYCDLEPAPAGAIWTDSEGNAHEYDFVQRNIRGNHVAVVAAGRAGPKVRIQLDSQDLVIVAEEPLKESPKMAKITLDNVEVEVEDTVASAIEKERAKLEARADAAELDAKNAKAELAKATAPETIKAHVEARLAVEKLAAKYELTADGKSEADVKREVVAKLNPEIKVDGKSDDYVAAAFDLLTAQKEQSNTLVDAAAKAFVAAPKADSQTAAERFAEMIFSKK